MRDFFDNYTAELLDTMPRASETLRPNLLPKSVFIHIPKTGGTFIREHFNEQEGWWQQLGSGHGNLDDFPECHDLFSFTFVRNPVDWLLSYWTFYRLVLKRNSAYQFQRKWFEDAIRGDITWQAWNQLSNPMEILWHENFSIFLEQLLFRCPNVVDLAYQHFTKGVDFVGKTENLVPDLIQALEMAGEDMSFYNPDIISAWATDKRNVTTRSDGFRYNQDLMQEIIKANPVIGDVYDS